MSVLSTFGKLRMSREESRAMLPTVARLLVLVGLINGVMQAFTVHLVTQSVVRAVLAFAMWSIIYLVIAVVVLHTSDRTVKWTQSAKVLSAVALFLGILALVRSASYLTNLMIVS